MTSSHCFGFICNKVTKYDNTGSSRSLSGNRRRLIHIYLWIYQLTVKISTMCFPDAPTLLYMDSRWAFQGEKLMERFVHCRALRDINARLC